MGVVLKAAGVLLMLAAGAAAAHLIERWLLRTRAEKGPAFPIQIKPDVTIAQADRWMYPAGPLSALFAIAAGLVVVPFDRHLIAADLGIGVFY
ncbi:MAG: hypothetical protein WAM73_16135, partial [Desulfobacterales bacterium]